uniref:very-long-chain (3R)-3-hydroxyacyl-CoA dehydratase-like isoform X2 n=1 Tax=Myxine glutinosa TaxID=7769 RepID=UPI00358FD725
MKVFQTMNLLETTCSGYLFLYSLTLFLTFSWVFINMTVRFISFGEDSMTDTFYAIGSIMGLSQGLAIFEIIHSCVGLIQTPVLVVILKMVGRCFILFVVIWNEEHVQNNDVVFAVFYLWSALELFRHPYYMLSALKLEMFFVTWLRYSAWIVLDPLSLVAEVVCIAKSTVYFGQYSIGFTSSPNMSIEIPILLYMYILVFIPAGFYVKCKYLMLQRRKLVNGWKVGRSLQPRRCSAFQNRSCSEGGINTVVLHK